MERLSSLIVIIFCFANRSHAQSANVTCIQEFCGEYAAECELVSDCRHCLSCINDCTTNIYPNDTSFEHWETQNCTSLCIATYGDQLFYDYDTCLTDHDCVTLAPIEATCLQRDLKLIDNFDINLFLNQSWMLYGRNYVYDCYPCQTFNFQHVNDTTYLYQPNYTMITLNDSYAPAYLSAPLTYEPGASTLSFLYEDQGMQHNESWYFIGQNVSAGWTVFYYCGSANTWAYEGGLVTSIGKTLSSDDLKAVESIVNKNGLNFSEWCVVDNDLDGEGCG